MYQLVSVTCTPCTKIVKTMAEKANFTRQKSESLWKKDLYHNTFTKWQTYYRSGPTRRLKECWWLQLIVLFLSPEYTLMLITPPKTVAPPKRANGLSCLFEFWLLLIFMFTNMFVGFMAWSFIVYDSFTFTVFSQGLLYWPEVHLNGRP
jgi:hypothetical protein